MPDIAIVGGGAAGMYAACAAASFGARVTLIERNKICGVKLNLTGKGRCNLTNNCDPDALMAAVTRNGKFLYSAFSACSAQDVMGFFTGLGVPLKTERGGRVFPESDSAKDITAALSAQMRRGGVKIINSRVGGITLRGGKAAGVTLGNGGTVAADRVILATGGLSYPKTGSSGDGYGIARAVGHTVTETRPSLVPLLCGGDLCRRLEGLSLRNVALSVYSGGKRVFNDFGEMLFTADGVSGPLVLSASAHLGGAGTYPCRLEIDLKPALTLDALDSRVLRDFDSALNKNFGNSLGGLLPAKLIPVVIELCGIPAGQKVNSVSRAQRESLCRLLKAFPLEAVGHGPYSEAIITSGGISTREINPGTMESKLVKGLYFAGEIIDVDAYTGGYNLQIAWSTGYLAGVSAAREDD